ncbi:hypothetical protein QQ045_007258 [Rhodiola kirilowii]
MTGNSPPARSGLSQSPVMFAPRPDPWVHIKEARKQLAVAGAVDCILLLADLKGCESLVLGIVGARSWDQRIIRRQQD